MSGQDKSSDAEEIFAEFEKSKADRQKNEEPIPKPTLEESEPESQPESTLEEPEPESQPESTESMQQHAEVPQQVSDEVKTETISTESSSDESAIRNMIFIGTKPIMTYVTATLTQLSITPKVTIKARGKRITQAVDVSQMIVKRMNSVGYEISDVRIASDSLTSQDGKKRNVSTMEIDVTRVKDK